MNIAQIELNKKNRMIEQISIEMDKLLTENKELKQRLGLNGTGTTQSVQYHLKT